MNDFFKVAKTYSMINHILVGLFTLIFANAIRITNRPLMIAFLCVWIGGFLVQYIVKSISRIPKYAFCVVNNIVYSGMAATIGLMFKSDLLFYALSVLGNIFAIFYIDKLVLNIQFVAQLVFVTIYSFLVIKPSVLSIIGYVIFFTIAWWVYRKYVEIYEKQNELRKNYRQSLDDMLDLVDEKYEEASKATKAKSLFLANMSHEIRTPINSILGFNTMILRESKDETVKSYALDIEGSGKSLLSIINDILDMSKIESGKMEIVKEKYSIASLLNDVINMISIKAEDKGLIFEIDVEETIPSELYGDDVRIHQILINILNNAVKYTPKGTVRLHVSETRDDDYSMIRFAVSDTGIGIKEEDMGKLFENFARLDEDKNHQIEGTGLGMSITTNLLAMMNSKLEVDSVYGEGSTFRFTLRQEIINPAPIGDLQTRIKESKSDYSYKEKFIAPEAKFLVVDDNAINRQVFKGLLKPMKAQIDQADSGKAALSLTREKKYDLIFLDHMMPEMDGIETLQNIREQEDGQNRDSYVIALTANAISGAKEMYLDAGFANYLSKPIEPAKLEDLIDEVLPDELKQEATEEDSITEEKAVADSMESYEETIEFPMIEGIDWANARLHIPDDEAILVVVKAFYFTIDEEADYIQAMYDRLMESPLDEEALSNYRIKVHAMKSTSYMFGAFPLAGMAATLEYAARDGELDCIESVTPFFLTRWRAFKGKLKELAVSGENEKTEDFDTQEIVDKIHALQEAVAGFDMHGMDELMEELQRFAFSEEVEALIESLSGAVMNFDADKTGEIGDKIIEKLTA